MDVKNSSQNSSYLIEMFCLCFYWQVYGHTSSEIELLYSFLKECFLFWIFQLEENYNGRIGCPLRLLPKNSA